MRETKNLLDLRYVFYLLLLLFITLPCLSENPENNQTFEFELTVLGFEAGKIIHTDADNPIHLLGEFGSFGLSYKIENKFGIQLTTKTVESFPSGFSGDYMLDCSILSLYLSLFFEANENSSFYFSVGTNHWYSIYEMYYTSSAIGFKQNFGNFDNLPILYLGCELQWLRISAESTMSNDIVSFNLIFGIGNIKKNFGL
jgi:hypothetical protein